MQVKKDFSNLVKPEKLEAFFNKILKVATDNKMSLDLDGVKSVRVEKFLDETSLLSIIRTEASNYNIRFGSKISAAYHLAKHALIPSTSQLDFNLNSDQIAKLASYLRQANETISSVNSEVQVTISQQGDSRTIIFKHGNNVAVVLESSGSIILCSYR